MQSSISWIAILCALFLLPGAGLLIMGIRGRRVGDEPRCRRCQYILLHLTSPQCPECGTEISPSNTEVGIRRRGWGWILAGCLLLIIGCLPFISPVTNALGAIPWYQYKPAAWVLADMDTPGVYLSAIAELQRRESTGQLPDSIRQKLIEKGLQEQVATTPARQELLDYVGNMVIAGKVSEQQKARFLDQLCIVTGTVRAVVAEGDDVPFRIWQRRRAPKRQQSLVFWIHQDGGERRIDGNVVPSKDAFRGFSLVIGGFSLAYNEPSGSIGKHVLEENMTLSVWYGANHEKGTSQLLGTRKATARMAYEVVPRDQAKVELLDSPELRQQVLAAVKLKSFTRRKDGYCSIQFGVTNIPCDMAFDLIIESANGQEKGDSFCFDKGTSFDDLSLRTNGTHPSAKVKVILRPSVDIARKTVDKTAIYGGELEFSDVTIEQSGN